jgi:hypothetical protein
MKVVILGAGSTIGTLGNSLGVLGFVQRLCEVHGLAWRALYPQLAEAIRDCGSSNLDRIWTHTDYAAKLARSICPSPDCPKVDGVCPRRPHDCHGMDYGAVSGQLRRALLTAYALKDELDELLSERTGGTLMQELSKLSAGDVLISLNWDTVGECVLRKNGAAPLVAVRRPPLDETMLNLVKPHGSLSWADCGRNGGVYWRQEGSNEPLFDPIQMDPRNSYPQPLLLGAAPIKDELIAGTQVLGGNPEIFELVADQWASVVHATEHTDDLVVIGYGFPPEDTYGRFLFRHAAKRRGSRGQPTIRYYALPKDTGRIDDALREMFGQDVKYTYEGPVKRPDLKSKP